MLDFLRRYQRYFFIVIAIVIVISFSFFGTQATLNAPQKIKDRPIGQAVDGSKIMERKVGQMSRFLSTDRSDFSLVERGAMPNYFNDGVIRKDLLGTGVGILLVNAYFNDLKKELEERMIRHKEFRPYCHPTAPFISAQNLWAQVLPAQKTNLERFLNEVEEMNPDTFALLVDLYLGESAFPPSTLREYLMFQQKHYDWIEEDPSLARANLNLFQCRHVQDWFGSRFVELSAQFIINAALIAKERGYKVSYEEARVDLIRHGYESLQAVMRKMEISEEEIANLWKQQLHVLGMSEKEAVEAWQQVMLFRRLFKDVGGAVFVDPHVYQTFYSFASKTADADLYHLPKELEIKDFCALMKLEFYLDQVAKNREAGVMLPQNFDEIAVIKKRCPELVEKRFLVEIAEVSIGEIALSVSLKETWEWQLEKENYELLEKEFPKLAVKNGTDEESYFAALESLEPELRNQIDTFSRKALVRTHPKWIENALDQKHMTLRKLSFSKEEELSHLLSVAALKGELEVNPEALEARRKLELYTADGEVYCRFHVLDRDLNETVLSFAEAEERGILDSLLEAHLEEAYPTERKKNPPLFKTEGGEWKPFPEVRTDVGRYVYADLLKNIEAAVVKLRVQLPGDRYEDLDGFYPHYRLFSHMYTAEREIRRLGDESLFLKGKALPSEEGRLPNKEPLDTQWALIKENKVFKNHEKSPWFDSEIFAMVEQSWSGVKASERGDLFFFQLKEKAVPSGNFETEMEQGQAILSKEAECSLMAEVVDRLKQTEAIHLSYDRAQRS
ncbi:hypothetical protein [Candidatus Neptunochlamydia vexilliferae]|nr:hypothetical protein [Candidatus Neptunochlamydia vexilliferae]